MITNIIEDHLNEALQKTVQFKLNGKVLREGLLMLYNIKDFYINFTIKTKKDQIKTYEIPIPFKVQTIDGIVHFSYETKELIRGNTTIKNLIKDIFNKVGKKSKFYNNVLFIESV